METETTKNDTTHTDTKIPTTTTTRNPNVGVHAVCISKDGTLMTVSAPTRTELSKKVSEMSEGWTVVECFKGKRLTTQTTTKYSFS